jgi:hypothetical protein
MMHTCALVVSDDDGVDAAMETADVGGRGVDWWAIGGRYSGYLPLVPNATTGKVYGDAMPGFEATLAAVAPPDAGFARGFQSLGRPSRPDDGVDQAARRDVDVERFVERVLPMVGMFVADGEAHWTDLGGTASEADVLAALVDAPGDARVSVVDIHF